LDFPTVDMLPGLLANFQKVISDIKQTVVSSSSDVP